MIHVKKIKTKYGPGQIIENVVGNTKIISYKILGEFHRDNGPAKIEYRLIDGKWKVIYEEWKSRGLTHREQLPAITIFSDLKIEKWYHKNKPYKIKQDDGKRTLIINLKSDDSTPCIDLAAQENGKKFYHFQLWGKIKLDTTIETYDNPALVTINTLCNDVLMQVENRARKPIIIKVLENCYKLKEMHRLCGPAVILDDFLNDNVIEKWLMYGAPIRKNLPMIDRHGKIIGRIDKATILDIMMENREYGNVLNKILNANY